MADSNSSCRRACRDEDAVLGLAAGALDVRVQKCDSWGDPVRAPGDLPSAYSRWRRGSPSPRSQVYSLSRRPESADGCLPGGCSIAMFIQVSMQEGFRRFGSCNGSEQGRGPRSAAGAGAYDDVNPEWTILHLEPT